MRFRFKAEYVFKEFIETLYQTRLDATDKVTKNWIKLQMNSTYGKLNQSPKPSSRILYSYLDSPLMNDKEVLVNMCKLPGPKNGHDVLMAEVIDTSKTYVGQCIHVAAYITAGARAYLCQLIREAETCFDEWGEKIKVFYCDTDSLKCYQFALDDPRNKWFLDKYMDQTELGKLKSETNNVGYDNMWFIQKKLNMVVKHQPHVEWKNDQVPDLVSSIAAKEFVIKAKGVPKKLITPENMLTLCLDHQSVEFKMPIQFKHDLYGGITKLKDAIRSLGFGNLARQPPDSYGNLNPHPTLGAFTERLSQAKALGVATFEPHLIHELDDVHESQ